MMHYWGEPEQAPHLVEICYRPFTKKLRIIIGELTTASIFARVMVHDTVKMTARLQYFHICSCNGS